MKSMSLAKPKSHRKFRPRVSLVAVAVAGCFVSPVYANGVNPNVVAGSATFEQSGSTQIVKNINGTIINWDALSVAKGETLFFDQAVGSSVLNRVIGVMINGQRVISPTEILGRITSQGTVAIVNTAGLMIGPGAVIDVARFIGSTIDITNENFLAGKLLFDVPSTSPMFATVKNQGTITTSSGGSVYLIGSDVINEGTIITPGGEVILAAGHTVSLIDTGTPGVKVEITGTEGKVTNLGTVLADAGRIGMVGALVRNSGTLNASSVVHEGGRIFLKASQDAYVDGNGRIVTTGIKGGQVEVLGNRVTVTDAATIDASGSNGGGTVLIGGDYQGKNAAIQNAENTYFGAGAKIKADATDTGDGGKVILWSNDTTTALGSVSVQGGANGGNGGFVETSGHKTLYASGMQVNALAAKGKRGTWLLDPTDLTIIHSSTTSYAGSVVTDYDINNALNSADLVYQADNNITVAAGTDIGTYSHSGASSLTLNAGNNILFGDGSSTSQITFMSSMGNLTLNLNASGSVTTTANTNLYFGSDGAHTYVNLLGGKTWNNFGTVSLGGDSQIRLWDSTNSLAATFNNKSTGTFTSNDHSGFAIYSESSSDSGVFNNDGVVNIKSDTAFEALYNQSSSGKTKVYGGVIFSLQNAGTVYGSVAIEDDARVWLSEVHGGARTFYNTTITGPGALDIGPSAAFRSSNSTIFSGVTLDGATLADSGGSLTVPTGITSYVGDVGFYASGDIEFSPDSTISSTGKMTLRAGWNGGGFGSSTAYALNDGVGAISVSGASVSAASMDWAAGGNIEIKGSSTHAALVQASGNQTLKAGREIRVYGGSAISNTGATVESLSGTQTLSANQIRVYGGGVMDNASTFSLSNNYGRVVANGTQIIEINGSDGELRMDAGYGITSGTGTGNYAEIRQNSSNGSQSITFKGTGSGNMTLYGGSYGANNRAEINGGMGDQQIGDHPDVVGTYRPTITLYGGNGGGSYSQGNEASVTLADANSKTRYVYADSLSIYGGAAAYGGAGFGGSSQQINLYNTFSSLYMKGGSSQNLDEDNVPATAAYIGGKNGADIRITTQGGVNLVGGIGSPVIIGSLNGTATVAIQTATAKSVAIYSDTNGQHGGVFIGSLAELGSTSALTSNDVMLGSNTSIVSGAGVDIRSYGGNVGLGYIEAGAGAGYGATITAHGAILDQNGSALNIQADSITLLSESGGSATSIAISADTKITQATGTLSATVNSGSNYGGISIRNTDDVGFGTQGSISLNDSAYYGGMGSEGGRFSLRFYNSGNLDLSTISVSVADELNDTSILSGGNMLVGSGYFSADNVLLGAAGNVTVADNGDLYTSGKLTLLSGQTLSMGSDSSVHSEWDLVVAAGNLSMDSGAILRSSEGNVSIATGALTIDSTTLAMRGVSTTTGTVSLVSDAWIGAEHGNVSITTGGLTMDHSEVSGYSGLTVTASNISADNHSSFQAGASEGWNSGANATFKVSGNMRLNNGSYINAGNDVYMTFSGKTSTLYLNDLPNKSAAYVLSDLGTQVPATTHLSFTSRASGGVYIDGTESLTTSVGKSGFFNTSLSTPAVAGEGLKLTFAAAAAATSNPATSVIDRVLQDVTNKDNKLSSNTTSGTALVVKPPTSPTAPAQTIGGDADDSFGGSEKKDDKSSSTSSSETKGNNNGKPAQKNQCS